MDSVVGLVIQKNPMCVKHELKFWDLFLEPAIHCIPTHFQCIKMEMDLDHRGSPRGDDAVDRRAGAKSSEISYTCQREFTGHSRSVSSVKFSEDGSCIASACEFPR